MVVKKLRLLVVVVGLFVCSQGLASAQGTPLGTLTRTDNSVTKVMLKAGCDIGWYSQVLVDTSIDPARVRRLPIGQAVVLENGSCPSAPPEHIASPRLR